MASFLDKIHAIESFGGIDASNDAVLLDAGHYLEPRIKFNPEVKSYKVHLGSKHEFDLRLYRRKKN